MIRKLLLLPAFIFLTVNLCITKTYGQSEARTLLKNGEPMDLKKVGFFLSPMLGISSMDGSTALINHIRGGVSVGSKVAFGAYASHSLNQIKPESETLPNIYMDYWSVGGFGEISLFSDRIVHLTLPIYLGTGEVQMDNEEGELNLGEARFTQFEPSVLLEMNLNKYLRVNLGTGYRFVSTIRYRNFNQNDLSGFTGYIGLKVGLFR